MLLKYIRGQGITKGIVSPLLKRNVSRRNEVCRELKSLIAILP